MAHDEIRWSTKNKMIDHSQEVSGKKNLELIVKNINIFKQIICRYIFPIPSFSIKYVVWKSTFINNAVKRSISEEAHIPNIHLHV